MRLLRGDGNGLRATVRNQWLKRLLGVLPGKNVDAGYVFLALQFVEATAQHFIRPPCAQMRTEAQIDRIAEVADAAACVIACGGVELRVHHYLRTSCIQDVGMQKRLEQYSTPALLLLRLPRVATARLYACVGVLGKADATRLVVAR